MLRLLRLFLVFQKDFLGFFACLCSFCVCVVLEVVEIPLLLSSPRAQRLLSERPGIVWLAVALVILFDNCACVYGTRQSYAKDKWHFYTASDSFELSPNLCCWIERCFFPPSWSTPGAVVCSRRESAMSCCVNRILHHKHIISLLGIVSAGYSYPPTAFNVFCGHTSFFFFLSFEPFFFGSS